LIDRSHFEELESYQKAWELFEDSIREIQELKRKVELGLDYKTELKNAYEALEDITTTSGDDND
jgi:hypothetical protein